MVLFTKDGIGYFYRSAAYMLDMSSKELLKLISPKYLRRVYYPYHTFDIQVAIEEVFDDLNIKIHSLEEEFRRLYSF